MYSITAAAATLLGSPYFHSHRIAASRAVVAQQTSSLKSKVLTRAPHYLSRCNMYTCVLNHDTASHRQTSVLMHQTMDEMFSF